MKPVIISVTGAHSDSGKTLVAEILLQGLRGRWGAIKYTRTAFYTSVREIDSPTPDEKDTSRLLRAGGSPVIWIQSPPGELKESLEVAMGLASGCDGIVIEGNSPIEFLTPDIVIFVFGEDPSRLKPSGRKALQRADLLISKDTIPEALLKKKEGCKMLPLSYSRLTERTADERRGLIDAVKRLLAERGVPV
jgi:molybdopterin-guanine dinucleotide biosynthesis protein